MLTADADTQSLAHTIPPSPHTAFNEAMGVQNEFEGEGGAGGGQWYLNV